MPKTNDPFAPKNIPPTPLTDAEQEIEHRKDRMNLKRSLDFVAEHSAEYTDRIDRFLTREPFAENQSKVDEIQFPGYNEQHAQITPDDIRNILLRIPPHLLAKSTLTDVNFSKQNIVFVPTFTSTGDVDLSNVLNLTTQEFLASNHHPERALAGNTFTGRYSAMKGLEHLKDTNDDAFFSVILPSAIPESVTKNPENIRQYQIHVFLHELFHSIENVMKDDNEARAWILNSATGRTFFDWREEYIAACAEEQTPPSIYASAYVDDLFPAFDRTNPKFMAAIREWMAEDWVGAHIGILPNVEGISTISKGKRQKLFEELLATPE